MLWMADNDFWGQKRGVIILCIHLGTGCVVHLDWDDLHSCSVQSNLCSSVHHMDESECGEAVL